MSPVAMRSSRAQASQALLLTSLRTTAMRWHGAAESRHIH